MANEPGFIDHCQELLAACGQVRTRRMFGGHGIYVEGLFIALVSANVLYLKADAQTRPAFEEAGSRPFEYAVGDGTRGVLSYWQVPEDAMDSPAGMQPWARMALGAALRQAAAKAVGPRRKAAVEPKSKVRKGRSARSTAKS